MLDTLLLVNGGNISGRDRRKLRARMIRQDTLQRKSEGKVGQSILPVFIRGVEPRTYDVPCYKDSNLTAKFHNKTVAKRKRQNFIGRVDNRCFFTGVKMEAYAETIGKIVFAESPWGGTRDHLVPTRKNYPLEWRQREILNQPISTIWCAHIVNRTFNQAPMPVKLKIRQWLSTTHFDRNTSYEAGINVKWIVVSMLDEFRYKNRLLWAFDDVPGEYLNPESKNFMTKMHAMEREFLALDTNDRNDYINHFHWNF